MNRTFSTVLTFALLCAVLFAGCTTTKTIEKTGWKCPNGKTVAADSTFGAPDCQSGAFPKFGKIGTKKVERPSELGYYLGPSGGGTPNPGFYSSLSFDNYSTTTTTTSETISLPVYRYDETTNTYGIQGWVTFSTSE